MDSTVLTALITAGAMVIVQIIISTKQQKVSDVKMEYTLHAMEEHIGRLEKKQDKHNNLIERMTIVERDLKTSFNKIDELKEDIHELRKSK